MVLQGGRQGVDRLEQRQPQRGNITGLGARSFAQGASRRLVQQPQGGFVMITAIESKLVENPALVHRLAALITTVNWARYSCLD